ncbi:hypothetical protein L9F63_026676, partial [Diploptera punctata]
VIRGINNISNKDDFFAGLVRVRSQFSNKNAKVVLTETGLVEINGELHLHPMKFWEINKLQREFILDATKNLNEGIWTQEHFNKEMQNICQEENLMLNSQENHNAPNMNRSYDRDLDPSSPDVIIKRLSFSKLLLKYTIEHRKEIIIIARNIAEMMECHNTAEIIKIVDFVANYVEEVAGEVEKKYQQDLSAAQREQGKNFNREKFDIDYNIRGDRRNHFIKTVITSYNTYEVLKHLKITYSNLKKNINTRTTDNVPVESQPNMELADSTEYLKQFAKQHRHRIISIAESICDILKLRSRQELRSVISFVAARIENILAKMEIKYKDNLTETMEKEGENFNKQTFDKKYNIVGERREHFVENIINNLKDFEQLKQLKTAYEESYSQSKMEPEPAQSGSPILYTEERNFKVQGDLTDEELYNVAAEVTGLYLFKGNATLFRDGVVSFVNITDSHMEPITIVITSDSNNNKVNATLLM